MSWVPLLLFASPLSHSSPLWQAGALETLLPLGCWGTKHYYGSVHDPPLLLRLRGFFGAILSFFTLPPTLEFRTPFASHSSGAATDPTDISFWTSTFLGRQDALPAWERNWGRVWLLSSLPMATVVSLQAPSSLWSQWWGCVGRGVGRQGSPAQQGDARCCRKGTRLMLLGWWLPWPCGNRKSIHNS